ncbi:PepSY domain-containing protein [Streptomyces evansiae]|uniref:PepSY domain-containing protein n=1 Tax=Streptomyces evansiae TaxID=3075535 RepID=UPI002887D5C1|nr:PepSY domain-containing protein [Streptomyces sp. DSM 41859]MDT0423439.1 PepSY domain-containing protein [Streptomyces sp. DSM 41859]
MKRKPVFAALAAAVVLAAGGGVAAASLGGDGGTSAASGTGTGATTHERAGLAGTGADDTAREDRDDDRDDRDSDDRDDDTRHGAGRDDAARHDDTDDTDDDQDDDARERAHDAAEHKAEAAAARKLAAPDALAAALAHTPGRALSAEIDDDQDGRLVWEVEILDSSGKLRHVDVSPSSGKVLGAHTERGDADDVRAAKDLLTGDATSAAKAARAAAAKGTVVSIDLEEERNGYWSVETGPGEAEWSVALDGAKVTRGSDD